MADYLIPENPDYMTAIRKLESTDPANAELFNTLFQRLIENTHAVKMEADGKSDSGHKHSPSDSGLGKNLTFTGAVTGTYNGEAGKTLLIPDRKGCRFVVGTSTAGWTAADCDYLCDGTDDQVEINNAISALSSTGGEIVILAGTYNLTSGISLRSNIILKGNGNSTRLIGIDGSFSSHAGSYCSLLVIKSLKNVIIENLCLESQANNIELVGIYIQNCNDIMVKNNTMASFYMGTWISECSCFTLSNNYVFECERGFWVTNLVNGGLIYANTLTSNEDAIFIYATSVKNTMVLGNYLYNNTNSGIKMTLSSTSGYYTMNGIIGNECFNNGGYGIYISQFYYVNLVGNCINNNPIGICCGSQTKYCLISDNIVYKAFYSSSEYSLQISGSDHLIANNMIWGKNYTNSGTNNTFANNKYN